MVAKILNDYEKGFLEGLIDGEGSLIILVQKRSDRIVLSHMVKLIISNNSYTLLQKAKNIIGAGTIVQKNNRKRGSTSYEYRTHSGTLRWLLPQLKFTVDSKEKRRLAIINYLNHIQVGQNQYFRKERIKLIQDLRIAFGFESIQLEMDSLNKEVLTTKPTF